MRTTREVVVRRGRVLTEQPGPVPPATVTLPLPGPGEFGRPPGDHRHRTGQASVPGAPHAGRRHDPAVPAHVTGCQLGSHPPSGDSEADGRDVAPRVGELVHTPEPLRLVPATPAGAVLAVEMLVNPEDAWIRHPHPHGRR